MDIIAAIRQRHSVRTFDGKALSPAEASAICEAIDTATSEVCPPFTSGSVTITLKQFPISGTIRPGTYGVISGASDYLLMALGDDSMSQLAGGFIMEHVILRATQLRLGTCWIGGTFKGSTFDDGLSLSAGQHLRIVSPVGHPTSKKRMVEKLMTMVVGSSKRKPFDNLFFSADMLTPPTSDSIFIEALEMMRLAPSARNAQPWRAVADDNYIHFYRASTAQFSLIDCGIGLCHFYLAMQSRNHNGCFETLTDAPAPNGKINGCEYLMSYRLTREAK